MITVEETSLPGVLLIKPYINEDFRGQNTELYDEKIYAEHGITDRFVLDTISVSRRHVWRGLHGDSTTAKLIACLEGSFYFVVVDGNKDSAHFGKSVTCTLSERNRHQVYVPAGYGNGHLVMSERAIFYYKQTVHYDGGGRQFTWRYDDPKFNLRLPVANPIVSDRDYNAPFLP